MRKLMAMLLAILMIMSMAACGSDDIEETTEGTTALSVTTEGANQFVPTESQETAVQEMLQYPKEVDPSYADFAVSLPKIIFTTTGAENGLAGSIYIFEGVLQEVHIYSDETNTFVYEDAIILTDGGKVTISNIYKTIYNATEAEYGQVITAETYPENVDNFVFPEEGESAQFIAVYIGYSELTDMPVFYLGACPSLYAMTDMKDPVAKMSVGEDDVIPTETSSTENGTDSQGKNNETAGERNALRAAKEYLSIMPFSSSGLIEQLEFDGYTNSEATYAAENCGANWNEQALKSAEQYLGIMAFSHSGLIDQLKFDGYTTEQAKYGADSCGADWEEQAAKAAKTYLDLMAFSKSSLIDQLEFDGFTHEQAVYGVEQNGL